MRFASRVAAHAAIAEHCDALADRLGVGLGAGRPSRVEGSAIAGGAVDQALEDLFRPMLAQFQARRIAGAALPALSDGKPRGL